MFNDYRPAHMNIHECSLSSTESSRLAFPTSHIYFCRPDATLISSQGVDSNVGLSPWAKTQGQESEGNTSQLKLLSCLCPKTMSNSGLFSPHQQTHVLYSTCCALQSSNCKFQTNHGQQLRLKEKQKASLLFGGEPL